MDKNTIADNLTVSAKEAFAIVDIEPQVSDGAFGVSFDEGVNCTIFFKGDIIGKVCLFIMRKDAEHFVSLMLDAQDDDNGISENDLLDGVGELNNIIVGGLKTHCHKLGCHFDISIPSTNISHIPRDSVMNNAEIVRQFYKCRDYAFQLTLTYRVAKKETPAPTAQEPKAKLSAADLLSQLIQKNIQDKK